MRAALACVVVVGCALSPQPPPTPLPTEVEQVPATPPPTTPQPTPPATAQPAHQWRDTQGQVCVASWYHSPYGPLTAAHRRWKKGQRVAVGFEGRWVTVVIADRGPYVRGRDIDLAAPAFSRLAPLGRGIIRARCVLLGS